MRPKLRAIELMLGREGKRANVRITGGLVSHDQAKRFLASPVGIRDMATGSKRAAICVAWSAWGEPSRVWQPRAEGHTPAATISRYRAVGRRAGRQNAGAPGALPLDLVDPTFAAPSQPDSIASCSPRVAAVDGRLITVQWDAGSSRCLSQVRGPCRSPAMSHRVGIAPDLRTGDGRSSGRAPSPIRPYR
jgi:hypothetical protein